MISNHQRFFLMVFFLSSCILGFTQGNLGWSLADTILMEKSSLLDSILRSVQRSSEDTSLYRKQVRYELAASLIQFGKSGASKINNKALEVADNIRYLNDDYESIIHDFESELKPLKLFKSLYKWYSASIYQKYSTDGYISALDNYASEIQSADHQIVILSDLGRTLFYQTRKEEASRYFQEIIALSNTSDLEDTLDVGRARSFLRQIKSLGVGSDVIPFSKEDIYGNKITVAKGDGKVTLIDFWATWCVPCVRGMPELQKIYKTYGDREDFRMIGISIDRKIDDLREYLEKHEIQWTQIFEKLSDGTTRDGDLAKLYNGYAVPTYYIIDRNGIIRYNFDSRRAGEELEEVLKTVMADE